jgi:hypothetical protein
MRTFRLGDSVWALYYDAERNAYEPRLEGKVTAIVGGCYVVGAKRIPLGTYPLFGSREEAEADIADRPFAVPEIKG